MRDALKALARGAAAVIVLPRVLVFWLWSAFVGSDRAIEAATQSLASMPGLRGEYLRRAFLARTLQRCHATSTICFGTVLSKADTIIDEHVYVGPGCHLGLVHLEPDVLLAAGVHIPSGGHIHGTADSDVPIRDQPGSIRRVRVGAGSWVGSASVILADVGRNCVIGAGSVVTRPIPDSVVAAGVPARVVRTRGAQTQGESTALFRNSLS
jgi:acetyltransferase-like isoleucine patch superfamily enzyme